MSRRVHKLDADWTARMGYSDKRSYVTLDGKEFRFGTDMSDIRMEAYNKAKGFCAICRKHVKVTDFELDHIISRGRLGDDSLGNLRILHRVCHRGVHVQPKLRSVL